MIENKSNVHPKPVDWQVGLSSEWEARHADRWSRRAWPQSIVSAWASWASGVMAIYKEYWLVWLLKIENPMMVMFDFYIETTI